MADDGYLIGYEDGSGNFVEVGRFNNAAEDTSQPILIEHTASGERMELDGNGFDYQNADITNVGAFSSDSVSIDQLFTGGREVTLRGVEDSGSVSGGSSLTLDVSGVDTDVYLVEYSIESETGTVELVLNGEDSGGRYGYGDNSGVLSDSQDTLFVAEFTADSSRASGALHVVDNTVVDSVIDVAHSFGSEALRRGVVDSWLDAGGYSSSVGGDVDSIEIRTPAGSDISASVAVGDFENST